MKRKIFVSLLCLPCTIYAQSAAHDSVHNIEQVVVTANRTAVNRSSVPMTISVVSRDELEQSSESNILAGLSERIPGMFVTERGVTGFGLGAGGGGGITIRGVGGTPTGQVLMLVDGQPQFMGIMGHHLPDSYVSSDVDRVEVIRGPASILYGSNAMGGVVNIITRRQHADGWNAGGRLMYGAYNTQKYMGNAGFKAGKFDAFVSVNHDRTDGHRENSDFSITNAYARAGYRMTDHLNLWGDVMVAKNRSHDPGKVSVPITDHIADVLRGMASITLQNTFEKADGALKLFYNFGEHEINDGYGDGRQTTPRDYRFRSNDYNLGVSLYQALHLLEGNTITAGVDFMGYGGRARNAFLDGRPDAPIIDTSHHAAAGYVIMQQSLFDKLTLNAGVRYEHNALYGGEWVPQAGLAYTPWRTAVVKASVGKGFRSPSIRELYLWGAANPDLEPEHAWSYELAVEQRLFSNRLDLELAAYAIDGSNLIQVVPPSTGKNMNTGKFLNTGFEFSFRWQALRDLGLQGSYSYLHMDTPLLYSPEHQAFLAASYRFLSRWNFSLSGRLVDGLYSEIGANPATETFVTLDARVSFQPLRWRWISFFAKGENLANRTYQIITGYPMPGITVFGGVNVSLR